MREYRFDVCARDFVRFRKEQKKTCAFGSERLRVVFNHIEDIFGGFFVYAVSVLSKKVHEPRHFPVFEHFPKYFFVRGRHEFFELCVDGDFIRHENECARFFPCRLCPCGYCADVFLFFNRFRRTHDNARRVCKKGAALQNCQYFRNGRFIRIKKVFVEFAVRFAHCLFYRKNRVAPFAEFGTAVKVNRCIHINMCGQYSIRCRQCGHPDCRSL